MSAKTKVLEIIGDATLSGAPRHLLSLLENLNYQKFSVFVISTSGPLAGEIKTLKKSINLEIIPMHTKYDVVAIKEIRQAIKKIDPDVIHIHGTRAGILARLASAGLKIPVIYTEHLWTNQYRIPGWVTHNVQLFGLWALDMLTTVNIAVSGAVREFLIQSKVSRPSKVVVIYNGIEPVKKKAKPFSKENEVLIGSIGTLNEQKGMQYLIKAMPAVLKEFPNAKLEIIGEGYYKDRLQRLVKSMKLTRQVKFTGFLKDVYEELEKLDLYVQPSLSESFGLAILQAMSVGLPVIATKTGGVPEVVTDGKTGLLVEPKNSGQLASAVLEILRDKEKAISMGKLAAEDATLKFSLKDMVEETEDVYEGVAELKAVNDTEVHDQPAQKCS